MAIDHSKTYREAKIRNIPHILRKRAIQKQIQKLPENKETYADFGCSNGYLTSLVSSIINPNATFGFDRSKNIEVAKNEYPSMKFDYVDLNIITKFREKFDVITCFETLEHVGNITNAVKTIRKASHVNSVILISVPIEIGVVGILKYVLKRFFFKDKLPLTAVDLPYFKSLVMGNDISKFRPPASGYSNHFGFDYRLVDKIVSSEFINYKVVKWNSFTTRFYLIQ